MAWTPSAVAGTFFRCFEVRVRAGEAPQLRARGDAARGERSSDMVCNRVVSQQRFGVARIASSASRGVLPGSVQLSRGQSQALVELSSSWGSVVDTSANYVPAFSS